MPITDKLNDLISDIGRLSGQPVSYSESGQTIESKVNYISKLLDNFNGDPSKLDAPTTPGTAGQVLTSDGDGGQVWAGVAAGEVVIDNTLSVQGAAAEAKAVGALKTAIDESAIFTAVNLRWSQGTIASATGGGKASSVTIRDFYTFYDASQYDFIKCAPGYVAQVFAWTGDTYVGYLHSDGTFAIDSSNAANVTTFFLTDFPNYKFKFTLRNSDASTIAPENGFGKCYLYSSAIDAVNSILKMSAEMTWLKNDGLYIKTNVTTLDTSAPYSSSSSYHGAASFFACSPGDVFIVSTLGSANFRPYLFCDSSGNIIAIGENVQYHNERVVAPANAAYVGFNSIATDLYRQVLLGESEIAAINRKVSAIADKYNGLACVAFGTSLTYRDTSYRSYLASMLGITIDNQGIGSSKITSDMLAAVKAYTGYSGKRIAILEGFVNDWYGNASLGTWQDTGETTACGCVRSAINYMLSQNANLTIFLVLDPYGRNYNSVDCSSTAENTSELTQYEYYEEIAKVGESLGIPVIRLYAGSQISENTPQYLSDNIHPTALGAKQTANFMYSKMCGYMPNEVT